MNAGRLSAEPDEGNALALYDEEGSAGRAQLSLRRSNNKKLFVHRGVVALSGIAAIGALTQRCQVQWSMWGARLSRATA